MYFVQADTIIEGKTYTTRCGRMTTNFKEACSKAIRRKGYIVDENRKLIGQAVDINAPKYIGQLKNISSGEDSFV